MVNYLSIASANLTAMKILFLLLFTFFYNAIRAQPGTISADKNDVCYAGVDNPLTVVVQNCPCNKMVLKVDNGKIEGGNCKYLYSPAHSGKVSVIAYKKNGKQLDSISEWQFRVKTIPDPVFKIGPYGKHSLGVSRAVLAAQKFVRADLENFDFDARFRVDSFSIDIYKRDTCAIKHFEVKSNQLPGEFAEAMRYLRTNDLIVFDKIFAIGPDGETRQLDPVVLAIKDYNPN